MVFENINIRQILAVALSYDAIIVDVRRPAYFQNGHIPMAINLPMSRIEQRQVNFPKSSSLVVYCDTGGASIKAARILTDMGYHVINCVGGLNHYKGSLTK